MGELIYNQTEIPREQYRYGLRASAAVGCGWIATYNALLLLGHTTDIEALIRYYEWQLPLIHGNLGTSFWAPAAVFRNWGFPVKVIVNRNRFDEEAARADACILFYHWRKGLKLGAHFVALHHTAAGFVGYNTYRDSSGPDHYGDSLEEFLKRQGCFGCVLIAIKQKGQETAASGESKKTPLSERRNKYTQ